jgi:hypothetical protein
LVLSLSFLQDVGGVNAFSYAANLQLGAKSATTLYFQLVDTSVGRRFMPAAGATVTIILNNLDNSKKITRIASQPFAQDASIWSVPILNTDLLTGGTVEVQLILNEGGLLTPGCLCAGIRVVSC